MKAAWTKAGLDPYIYPAKGPQLTHVDQKGCVYDNGGLPWDPKFENLKGPQVSTIPEIEEKVEDFL